MRKRDGNLHINQGIHKVLVQSYINDVRKAANGMSDQLTKVVTSVVEEQLAPVRIVSVSVEEDIDHDGDPVLRVSVVFESEDEDLDPDRVLGLVRHLREPLKELQEARFPIFSFMTPDEVDGAAA